MTCVKRAKLQDIAKMAKVSRSTVSLVMLNRPGVSPATRTRVMEVAGRMGYMPQPGRRPARNGAKPAVLDEVLFLVEELSFVSGEAFYSLYYQGVKDVLEAEGYHPNLVTLSAEQLRDQELPLNFETTPIHGLIVGGELPSKYLKTLSQTHLPIVTIGSTPALSCYSIQNDNLAGGMLATRHLIKLGHSKILCLANSAYHPNIQTRMDGYTLAMAQHFGHIHRKMIVADKGGCRVEDGFAAVEALLAKPVEFTAIFATTDAAAIGALSALNAHGLRVPEQISVVGFDNIEWSQHASPPLTTVDISRRHMGRIAGEQLLTQMRAPQRSTPLHANIITPVTLIQRDSTGPCPK